MTFCLFIYLFINFYSYCRRSTNRTSRRPDSNRPSIEMSWGSGSSGGWGKSGWSSQDSGSTDPNGQHNGSCIAEYSGWGKRGPMSSYYDSKCTGCDRDRASRPWGSNNSSKGNKIIKGLCLLGGAKILKDSIWD